MLDQTHWFVRREIILRGIYERSRSFKISTTIPLKIQIVVVSHIVNHRKISELQIPLRNIIKFFDSKVRIFNLPMIKKTQIQLEKTIVTFALIWKLICSCKQSCDKFFPPNKLRRVSLPDGSRNRDGLKRTYRQ